MTVSTILTSQVTHFVDQLAFYNRKRPHPRSEKDFAYLKHFFIDFIEDRNNRADEVASKIYQEVVKLAQEEFPKPAIWNMCIDGRVLPILVFGASATIGSSIRLPGGIIRDFIRNDEGKLVLKKKSNYAKLLDRTFHKYNEDILFAVFDSHLACAARLGEEMAKGRNPQDAGLFADISHKKQMVSAVETYMRETYGQKRQIIPIQTSFDPKTGFLFMGLETEEAREYARHRGGFTQEVIDQLVREHKVIATESLEENEVIHEEFTRHFFDLEWIKEYVSSSKNFWKGIAAMRPKLSPILEKLVLEVYPGLAKQDHMSKLEKEERILLLLTNAFSGFLHNHKVTGKKGKEVHLGEENYPYGTHQEQGVKISHDGYAPFDISIFVFADFDDKNLLQNILLSEGLVRKNRLEGRVPNDYGLFANKQDFVEASVPVMVQEVTHEEHPQEVWDNLARLNWHDLPEDWDEISDRDFFDYLYSKSHMPSELMIAINNLRHRMAILYEPGNPISSHFVEHYKVALPLLVDKYRKVKMVIPFMKLGFK